MRTPTLIIIAGCNGSGKSENSKYFCSNLVPFDYDKLYRQTYNNMFDSDIRDQMAKNKTTQLFENSINHAFSEKKDFCYETNFHNYPIYWAEKAKKLGYRIQLIFFCLNSLELAKKRVTIRAINNGHFVRDDVIAYKWKEGYKNLNLYYTFFDSILLVDNTKHNNTPKPIFELINSDDNQFNVQLYTEKIPDYSQVRFPEIYNTILDQALL